jgi:hypothetical protein
MDQRITMRLCNVRYSADPVDFSGRLSPIWILSVGYAHGPDDLSVLVVWSGTAPMSAEGIDKEKSASALGG